MAFAAAAGVGAFHGDGAVMKSMDPLAVSSLRKLPLSSLAGFGPPVRSDHASGKVSRYDGSPTELVSALHNSSDAISAKEAYQSVLVKVRRMLGFFKQQVHAATESRIAFDQTAQHLRELTETLETEVRNVTSAIDEPHHLRPDLSRCASPLAADQSLEQSLVWPSAAFLQGGSTDVIRKALHDAHRRCDHLNVELLKQTQVNDELLGALSDAKKANRRYVEHIKQQTEELDALTRQRVAEGDRNDDLLRKQRVESALGEKELHRRLEEVSISADAKCEEVRRAASAKHRKLRAGMEDILREILRLRGDNNQQRQSLKSLVDATNQFFQETEHGVGRRVDGLAKRHMQVHMVSTDSAKELEHRIVAEQEMRVGEVASWSKRHALLLTERDNLQALMTRNVSQLSAQVQALERSREDDRRLWAEERVKLTSRGEEVAEHRGALERYSVELRGTLSRAEFSNTQLDQEFKCSRSALLETQTELKAVQHALASAEYARTVLEEKGESQRQRLNDAKDQAVASCREAADSRLASVREESRLELAKISSRLQHAESAAQTAEQALACSRAQSVAAGENVTTLRCDLDHLRRELLDVGAVRASLEKEVTTTNSGLVDERQRVQAAFNELELQRNSLEVHVQELHVRLTDNSQRLAGQEKQEQQQRAILEASIKDRDFRIKDLELGVAELRDVANKNEAEAASYRQQVADLKATLEKMTEDGAQERRRMDDERKRLEEVVTCQAASVRESQEQYEKWRATNMEALDRVQYEKFSREAELYQTERVCGTELKEATRKMNEAQASLETSHEDIARLRHLLNSSQSELEQLKRDRAVDASDKAKEREKLDAAVKRSLTLEALREESTASMTRQAQTSTTSQLEASEKCANDMLESKRERHATISEYELRLETMRKEHESRLRSIEGRLTGEISRLHDQLDALLRENEQLKRVLSETRASQDRNSVQSQLENQIGRLQQHTDDLRKDLNRSSSLGSLRASVGIRDENSQAPVQFDRRIAHRMPSGVAPASSSLGTGGWVFGPPLDHSASDSHDLRTTLER